MTVKEAPAVVAGLPATTAGVTAGSRRARANELTPVRTAAWNDLDTTAKIAGIPHLVEVVALDRRRTVLATSLPATPD